MAGSLIRYKGRNTYIKLICPRSEKHIFQWKKACISVEKKDFISYDIYSTKYDVRMADFCLK